MRKIKRKRFDNYGEVKLPDHSIVHDIVDTATTTWVYYEITEVKSDREKTKDYREVTPFESLEKRFDARNRIKEGEVVWLKRDQLPANQVEEDAQISANGYTFEIFTVGETRVGTVIVDRLEGQDD